MSRAVFLWKNILEKKNIKIEKSCGICETGLTFNQIGDFHYSKEDLSFFVCSTGAYRVYENFKDSEMCGYMSKPDYSTASYSEILANVPESETYCFTMRYSIGHFDPVPENWSEWSNVVAVDLATMTAKQKKLLDIVIL